MQASINKQRGLTFISLVLVLGLIAFFTLLVLKVGPIYLNHYRVLNALAAVEKTPDIVSKSKQDIKLSLAKRLDMNYADHVTPDDFNIIAQPGYVKVDLEYERVEPIFGNLSVLVQFHEGFETGNR